MKSLVFLFFLSLPPIVCASWVTNHPQVGNIAKAAFGQQVEIEVVGDPKADPHHYEPTSLELKKLIKAKKVILAPFRLVHWGRMLPAQREGKETIVIQHRYEHFWLHPQALCQVIKILNPDSNCKGEKLARQFESWANKWRELNPLVVFDHPSFSPLFRDLKIESLALNHGHHQQVSPSVLKKLSKALKGSRPVLWVKETQIEVHASMLNEMEKQAILIPINTLGTFPSDPQSVLMEFLARLKKIPLPKKAIND